MAYSFKQPGPADLRALDIQTSVHAWIGYRKIEPLAVVRRGDWFSHLSTASQADSQQLLRSKSNKPWIGPQPYCSQVGTLGIRSSRSHTWSQWIAMHVTLFVFYYLFVSTLLQKKEIIGKQGSKITRVCGVYTIQLSDRPVGWTDRSDRSVRQLYRVNSRPTGRPDRSDESNMSNSSNPVGPTVASSKRSSDCRADYRPRLCKL